MMYLSRIAINKGLRKAKQALAFPQMMHAAVLGSFPPGESGGLDSPDFMEVTDAGASGNVGAAALADDSGDNGGNRNADDARVLWRTDTVRDNTWLYVVSGMRPDFSHIVEQFGWPDAEQGWEAKDYEPFLSRLDSGQHWRFRLHANPVYTVDGRVCGHVTGEQQRKWLISRAERNGFSFPQIKTGEGDDTTEAVQVIHRNILKFRKKPNDRAYVTLAVATFEGELIVEDAALLRRALTCGIGRAKAYGCGLLTLARAE
jgi:CRISPR system Cascade subunit CasE